jgi:CBS domain-containing protein
MTTIDTPASQLLAAKKGQALHCIHPDKTVFEAIEEMAGKNIGSLLVMENEELLGILTERDYTRKVILQGRASKTSQSGRSHD